jgi:hypothetical protein
VSALNRFVKDGDSDPSITAILSGFEVRLPETSVEETYAASAPTVSRFLL